MSVAIEFRNVAILFSADPSRKGTAALKAALAALDAGSTRADIAAKTRVVVGVANASLEVASGEISVLMGLSGSGKSTLLRAANGLTPVSRGQVLVADGEATVDVASCDRTTLRRIRRQRIAMVFQQFGLLPWRSVRDNVGLGLELRGEPAGELKRIVEEKLALVGLSQWADRAVGELSGGMQQRVGLARAFATDADVLLMDEPFSALDPLIRSKLQDELLSLQQRVRKTILFVSHDLDEALKLGDHISILEGGRIVQTGTAEDIVLRPADDYVAEFVHHMNPLTVLTGEMIMRPLAALVRDGAALWLDPARRARIGLDAGGRPASCTLNGVPAPLVPATDEVALPPTGALATAAPSVALAPAEFSLQAIIRLCQQTGLPVLLRDAAGRVVGACGEREIVAALAGRRAGAAGQEDAAN